MKVDIGNFELGGKCKPRRSKIEISTHDLWNLDHTLALVIRKALRKFKKRTIATPCQFTKKEWEVILAKMIYAFNAVAEGDTTGEDWKEKGDRIKEGLLLFATHFQRLAY